MPNTSSTPRAGASSVTVVAAVSPTGTCSRAADSRVVAAAEGRAAGWAALEAVEVAQALVSEYAPGTPLGWHRDVPEYEEIIGVSLGHEGVMRLRHYPPGQEGGKPAGPDLKLTLEAPGRSTRCRATPDGTGSTPSRPRRRCAGRSPSARAGGLGGGHSQDPSRPRLPTSGRRVEWDMEPLAHRHTRRRPVGHPRPPGAHPRFQVAIHAAHRPPGP